VAKYSTFSKDESKFEHSISPSGRWTIKENNTDFRVFAEALYFGIWGQLGRTFVTCGINL